MELSFNTNLTLAENLAKNVEDIATKFGVKDMHLTDYGNGTLYTLEHGKIKFSSGALVITPSKSTNFDNGKYIEKLFADVCNFGDHLKSTYKIVFDYGGAKDVVCYLQPNKNGDETRVCGFSGCDGTWYHLRFNPRTKEALVYCNFIMEGWDEISTSKYFRLKSCEKLAEI